MNSVDKLLHEISGHCWQIIDMWLLKDNLKTITFKTIGDILNIRSTLD